MNITKDQADKVIAALEKAGAAKLADGTYLDNDCSITIALSIMRGLAEDAEPETAMIDAAMLAMKGIYPPLRRSECQQLIRAAFASTSPQAAQTALKSESSAQAAQAPARLPSEGKPIEALALTEAALRDVVRQSEDMGLYDADFQTGRARSKP